MKRFSFLIAFIIVANNIFATGQYGDYEKAETPGWLTFMGLILIAWGILEIILFFKLWGMTNDVKSIKKGLFNEECPENVAGIIDYLRKNLILGNKEIVRKALLQNFISNVIKGYNSSPSGTYVQGQWVVSKEINYKKSISNYVDNLQKQFDKIGEELPLYIKNMKTYGDFFNLFVEEDFIIKTDTNNKTE